MPLRINNKNQLLDLIKDIEAGGGDATELKRELDLIDTDHESKLRTRVPNSNSPNDEEYLEEMRRQSPIEYGVELECRVCHNNFDHLISDTCENCFRNWALSAKPTGNYRRA